MNPNLSKYVIDEVEKMLHCRDPEYGFLTYKCPECGATKTIPLAPQLFQTLQGILSKKRKAAGVIAFTSDMVAFLQ
jgi:hypothetical protein